MAYNEEDFLQLSGLQHFSFCRRQWALIHLEQQWAENLLTVQGNILHEKAHDPNVRERRGDVIAVRGMAIHSPTLGISGECDVVEFHADSTGVPIRGFSGTWLPYPVEYKRGVPKSNDADRLQLCAQAMCLEEMLCCEIPEGALFYGEPRRRELVVFTTELRERVQDNLREMHNLAKRGHTPQVRPCKSCNACSLKDFCLPKLNKRKPVEDYLRAGLEETP